MTNTVAQALTYARTTLADVSDTPNVESRHLLGHVLGKSTTWLMTYPDHLLEDKQHTQFLNLLGRRVAGTPLAYVLGRWSFYQWEFVVNEHVLIPRPETEELVRLASEYLKVSGNTAPTIVDVGTGSGIIAISLALLFPAAKVIATDISSDALAVARENAQRLQARNVEFIEGNLLEPLSVNLQVDMIVANLPYIDTDVVKGLDVWKWEPHIALDGGPAGLRDIRQLLQQAPTILNASGIIWLEIGIDQGEFFLEIQHPYHQAAVYPDLTGRDRIVSLQLQELPDVNHPAR